MWTECRKTILMKKKIQIGTPIFFGVLGLFLQLSFRLLSLRGGGDLSQCDRVFHGQTFVEIDP